MQHSRGWVRVASSVVVLGLLVLAAGCGDKSNNQSNEGVVCNKGERGCDGNVMSVCNPSQSGWKTYKCASEDSCLKGIPYSMCAELVGDAGVSDCTSVAPMDDCNSNMALDGCETNTATSLKHCGICGNECGAANGTPRCVAGQCYVDCKAGFANCDGDVTNGCETDLNSDAANCGVCSSTCDASHGAVVCWQGKCKVQSCDALRQDCDGIAQNGCETDVNTPQNCGTCGNICGSSHAAPACLTGACKLNCESGFGDCDAIPSNGCESNLIVDLKNCGACGVACTASPNADSTCVGGVCAPACKAGFDDCNKTAADGCEALLGSDLSNCGACGNACSSSHNTSSCAAGKCVIGACSPGYLDCDGNAPNGCETDLANDSKNCGACGKACLNAAGISACVAGTCLVQACNAGFADCDKLQDNGCEASLSTEQNCGQCGKVCAAIHGTATCEVGGCHLVCETGFANCDGDPSNGCETNIYADGTNCGACGNKCSPQANAGAACSLGKCGISCQSGYGNCDLDDSNGCEAATAADQLNCGRCGNKCVADNASLASCVSGACQFTCNANRRDCDGNGNNGCEADLGSVNTCGSCSNPCSSTNASVACNSGACAVMSCTSGFGDCKTGNDGCETNLKQDAANCGACGKACSSNHVTASCSSGTCQIGACESGYYDCDVNPDTGCEANLQSDIKNCGACNRICGSTNASPSCLAGGCILGCLTGYQDCDTEPANGCEAALKMDKKNCGTCGKTCPGECTNGVCQPAILAQNQASLVGIAVDTDYVYWINSGGGVSDGSVWRIVKNGTAAAQALSTNQARPCGITVDLTGIYWTNRGTDGGTDGAVRGLLKSALGSGAFDLATSQQMPCSIAVAMQKAYWVDEPSATLLSKVMAMPLAGGGVPDAVYTAPNTLYKYDAVAADSSSLYTGIYMGNSYGYQAYSATLLSPSTTQVNVINTSGAVVAYSRGHIAPAAGSLVCTVQSGVVTYSSRGRATGRSQPAGVASDGKLLYWAESGAIMRVAVPTTSATAIAWTSAVQHAVATSPTELVMDDGNLYYLEPTLGRVMAVPR